MSIRDKGLYLDKLTVSFDGLKAVNELTLCVEPGEMRCIIGPNGAGKTTMMDVITGKTRPDSGTARFGRRLEMLELPKTADSGDYWQGIDLLKMSEPEIAKAGIGRKFQKPTGFAHLTVFDHPTL